MANKMEQIHTEIQFFKIKVSCIYILRGSLRTTISNVIYHHHFNFLGGNSSNLSVSHHCDWNMSCNPTIGVHEVLPTFTGTIFIPWYGENMIY